MEARVAQLWFWEGHYSRRGIDLRRHYDPEPLVITDLDLLAFSFSPMLQRSKTIGETKSGTGRSAPKPLDRIVWLRGLKELVRADHAELTSSITPSARARELARSLGVRAQSTDDVNRREKVASVAEVSDVGSQGTGALLEQKWVHKHCSKDRDLERAYWFLRSEVWFLDEVTASKRLMGLYRQLSSRWTPAIDDDDARALRWLFAETVSVFTLNVVTVAADALVDDAKLYASRLSDRLSAGIVPADKMRRISKDVDKFIGGVLAAADAPAAVRADAIGALDPQPPDWTEPFIELAQRLAAAPAVSRDLPRQVDLLVFERVVRRRHVPEVAAARARFMEPDAGRLTRLIAAFLRSQSAQVEVVDKAMTAPVNLTEANGAPNAETTSTGPGQIALLPE